MRNRLGLMIFAFLVGSWSTLVPTPTYAPLAEEERSTQVHSPNVQQRISPELEAGLQALASTGAPDQKDIVDAIRKTGTSVVFDDELPSVPGITPLPSDVAGVYLPAQDAATNGFGNRPYIIVPSVMRSYPATTLGAILAHEGWHAREDLVFGRPSRDPFACLGDEMNAFSSQARYWSAKWPAAQYPSGMPNPTNDVEEVSNLLLLAYRTKNADTVYETVVPILDYYLQTQCRVTRPAAAPVPGGSATALQ